MPTREEAKTDGRPFRVEVNVQTGEETVIFLTGEEIAVINARKQQHDNDKASRGVTRDDAIDAFLQKEANDLDGDPTVKAYIASL